MSVSADRKPSQPLLSWSGKYQADIASVDTTFAEAGRTLVGLLPRRFERHPSFTVKRGREADVESSAPFRHAQIQMTANASEVTSAPEDMQRLFLDLGVQNGDEIAIGLSIAKRSWRANPELYAERVYEVTLVPTTHRPDLLGIAFNDAQDLWFLKSGTPVDRTKPADMFYGSSRVREIGRVFRLMQDGLVYGSYEEGTHASQTRFEHKPHPYLAAIHRATADWIVGLVNSRMAR